MNRVHRGLEFTKEWINNYPKTINSNGCWIPVNKPYNNGYVSVEFNYKRYLLHRLAICIFNNIDYDNKKIDTRHSKDCDRACFNPEHLKPGTKSQNAIDTVEHGKHYQINKTCCAKCGGELKIHINKTGWNRGLTHRFCPVCRDLRNKARAKNKAIKEINIKNYEPPKPFINPFEKNERN